MADSSPVSSGISENETPAQKQARLRRERRNAKIQTGGNDRLNKIMSLNGRSIPASDDALPQSNAPANASQARTPQAFQPPDPDMSDPFVTPGDTSEDPMMRMMQQMMAAQPNERGSPAAAPQDDPVMRMMQQMMGQQAAQQGQGATAPQQDPMMRMMQQMMGPQAGQQGQTGAPPQDDPMKLLQQMMGGAQPQMGQGAQTPTSTYVWRIVHALFAVMLALYVGLWTPFTGTKIARAESQLVDESLKGGLASRLFVLFATAELVLQSGRYFLEKGQISGSGIIGTLAQFIPEPWAGYLRVIGRYGVIYTTIMTDAMVILFVLGVLAWWNSSGT